MHNMFFYLLLLSLIANANLKASSDVKIVEEESPDPLRTEESSSIDTASSFDAAVCLTTRVEESPDYFRDKFPPLVTPKDNKAKQELIDRTKKLYGSNLAADPSFYQLIDPLISITPDGSGNFHLSFVMSDFYLSCLKLYDKLGCFTYEGLLRELEKPNGKERYRFTMMSLSSFSHPTALSRTVWQTIFNLQDDRFERLKGITHIADRFPLFKLSVLQEVFRETFEQSNWNKDYWDRFLLSLSRVNPTIEQAREEVQKYRASALLLAAR